MAELLAGYLTVAQAARQLGVSPDLVRLLMRSGRLPHVHTPYGRLISQADVERLAQERQARLSQRQRK